MPLGKRIAHMPPEGRLGVLDPLEEAIVSAVDGRFQVLACA
jgi:hypothetical protein